MLVLFFLFTLRRYNREDTTVRNCYNCLVSKHRTQFLIAFFFVRQMFVYNW